MTYYNGHENTTCTSVLKNINCMNDYLSTSNPPFVVVIKTASTCLPIVFSNAYENRMQIDTASTELNLNSNTNQTKQFFRIQTDTASTELNLPLSIEAINCLNQLYHLSLDASPVNALGFIFESIEKAFAVNNLLFINDVISNFDPNRTKQIIAIGLLRVTFRARCKIPGWNGCLTRVIGFLNSNTADTNRLLRGLLTKDDSIAYSRTETIL